MKFIKNFDVFGQKLKKAKKLLNELKGLLYNIVNFDGGDIKDLEDKLSDIVSEIIEYKEQFKKLTNDNYLSVINSIQSFQNILNEFISGKGSKFPKNELAKIYDNIMDLTYEERWEY